MAGTVLLAQLGDVNPYEHGGFYVLLDTDTGEVSAEVLHVPDEEEFDEEEPEDDESWDRDVHSVGFEVHYLSLDRCTYINGVLSDNPFHPDHPAWFANTRDERAPNSKSGLEALASHIGEDVDILIGRFCSENPVERARAYEALFNYWGDQTSEGPLELNLAEVKERYSVLKGPGN